MDESDPMFLSEKGAIQILFDLKYLVKIFEGTWSSVDYLIDNVDVCKLAFSLVRSIMEKVGTKQLLGRVVCIIANC